jgi:hypothetical protein
VKDRRALGERTACFVVQEDDPPDLPSLLRVDGGFGQWRWRAC